MLRDNLAGLIEPMVDRAGAHPLGGHHQAGPNGGCSRSTGLASVALKRSWRPMFRWKTGRPAEKAKWPYFEVITTAHDSPAVGTAWHQSHRTIDPQCLKKSPPRRGRNLCTNGERRSPFHAEPRHNLTTLEMSLHVPTNCRRRQRYRLAKLCEHSSVERTRKLQLILQTEAQEPHGTA